MTSTETEQREVVSLDPGEKKDFGKLVEAVRTQCHHQRLEREICCRSGERRMRELMVVDCCCEVRALLRCLRRVRSKKWMLVWKLTWKMLDDCRKVMVRGRGRGLGMSKKLKEMDMKLKRPLELLQTMGLVEDTKVMGLDRMEMAQYSTLMMNKKKMGWDTTGLAKELMK